jgi:hypothetical protein
MSSTGQQFIESEEFRIYYETEQEYNKRLDQNKIDARMYEGYSTDKCVDFIRIADALVFRWYHNEIARRLNKLDETLNENNILRDWTPNE